jgi:hypothetical protein
LVVVKVGVLAVTACQRATLLPLTPTAKTGDVPETHCYVLRACSS